ncbi:hypothetical protein [Luteolibacter marinus]|uniref:hypothetical protein n=1 Tax=Luteolibacter marinus TaxID=2776705 RepID=UPI001866ECAE|nr:hypothetical protein [Luteolibacter marinus]
MKELGAEGIREMICDLAIQMIRGDLTLRELGAIQSAGPGIRPGLLVPRRMRGKLDLSLNVDKESGFLFFVFKRQRWAALQFAAEVELEPTLDKSDRQDLRLSVVPPAPLHQPAVPNVAMVTLRLPGDIYLWAHFPGSGDEAVVAFGGPDVPPPADDFIHLDDTPSLLLERLLSAMASWVGSTQGDRVIPPPVGEVRAPHGAVDTSVVLQQVPNTFAGLSEAGMGSGWEKRAPDLTERRRRLDLIHPQLPPWFHVSGFRGRIAMWVTPDGRIAVDEDDGKPLKLAYDYSLHRRASHAELRLRPFAPDFHVDGPFFDQIMRGVRAKMSDGRPPRRRPRRRVGKPGSGPMTLSAELRDDDFADILTKAGLFHVRHRPELDTFFRSGEFAAGCAVIRAKRTTAFDEGLVVLIRGTIVHPAAAWFIFSLDAGNLGAFNPTIRDIRLEAGFNGDDRIFPRSGRESLSREFRNYLTRLLRAMHFWDEALG